MATSCFASAWALLGSVVHTLMAEFATDSASAEHATSTIALPSPLCNACMLPSSPHSQERRGKKRTADSPVSVVEVPTRAVPEAQKQALLPLTTLTLLLVYTEIVQRRLWDASFARGPRAGDQPDASTWTRRLATRHLKAAATDGWNVVAGAVQLAQAWALLPGVVPTTLTRNYEYPLCIRLRLAVCLSMSWKFQRCNYSHFPRRFDADPPSLLGPHSHELASIGFFFMLDAEQKDFGGWHTANAATIRELYEEMMAHEVDLLARVNVFSLLTDNVQVRTESLLDGLLSRGVVTADCAMAARSIVPFFIYCAAEGRVPTAGGLVCAALVALSNRDNVRAKLVHSEECLRGEFSHEERLSAWGLVHNALFPTKLVLYLVQGSCYNDPAFENYDFVTPDNLRVALVLTAAAAS